MTTLAPGDALAAAAASIAAQHERVQVDVDHYEQLLRERDQLRAVLRTAPFKAARGPAIRDERLATGATWQALSDRYGYAGPPAARAAALTAARSEDERQRLLGQPTREEHEEAVRNGQASPYGPLPERPPASRMSAGNGAEAAPFCGDCGAIRSGITTELCHRCGSAQPPNLSRLGPRARHMIGQGSLR